MVKGESWGRWRSRGRGKEGAKGVEGGGEVADDRKEGETG